MKRRSKAAIAQRRKTVARKRRNAPKNVRGHSSSAASRETDVARLSRELSEALERQTATSAVLKVISSSPSELEPVFQVILENGIRICEAKFGHIVLLEGNLFRMAVEANMPTKLAELFRQRGPFEATPGSHLDRVMRTKQVSYAADDTAEPVQGIAARYGGARSIIAVPMLKDDVLIGAIMIYRQEVRPFSDKQIALVQNFASQAVIAVENARLLKELRRRTDDLTESLQQQTATSEVLRVISSSPGELEPVFQAMLENATHICEAQFGVLYHYDDGAFYPGALVNAPSSYADFVHKRGRFLPQSGNALDRALQTKSVVQIEDVARDRVPTPSAKLAGARSQIIVPMLKESELIGAIAIYRQEVRSFTDRQIELVKNFAAQAVIAIENTRLLKELRESLQQQTSTADVLKVISRSTFDLQAVLNTLTE
jgi:GAF domain-containing protein